MYNDELEKLIDAALADGELTDKEKKILLKKAQALCVDIDEFEMVLDARLFIKKKEIEESQKLSEAPKSSKYGNVRKCPNCGAVITDYTDTKCRECGFIFNEIKVNSSMQRLSELILNIQEKHNKIIQSEISKSKSSFWGSEEKELSLKRLCDKEIANCILSFPISNAKGDLIEFISAAESKIEATDDYKMKNIWRGKWKECIKKAEMFYPNDPDFAPWLKNNKTSWSITTFWQGLSLRTRSGIIAIVFYIILFTGGTYFIYHEDSSYDEGVRIEKERLDSIYNQCTIYIENGELTKAESTANSMIWTYTPSYSHEYEEVEERYNKQRDKLLERIYELKKNQDSKRK